MPDFANTITRAARTLTEQEQRKLLAVTGQRRDGWRDHVIFSVALGAGRREHEILALNVGDVFDDLGRARRRKGACDRGVPAASLFPAWRLDGRICVLL